MSECHNDTSWQELRDRVLQENRKDRVRPITANQGVYLKAMKDGRIVICTGPAGTGKSWMACGYSVELLQTKRVKRIIITRPMVTCGKGPGFLPGDLDEKFGPYVRPLLDAFEDFLSPPDLLKLIHDEVIQLLPLDMMRGSSLKDAVIICDEGQNFETFSQGHMLVTRIAKGSKLIITGDTTPTQTDVKHAGMNPLDEMVLRFKRRGGHPAIKIVELTREDIVRESFLAWVDETLTMPFDLLEEEGPEEFWYDVDCPNCGAELWYQDDNDEVEQVKCYRCDKHINLFDEDDEYVANITKDVLPNAAATYPEAA
jgi:phosphate starvation-inducible protein PhoH